MLAKVTNTGAKQINNVNLGIDLPSAFVPIITSASVGLLKSLGPAIVVNDEDVYWTGFSLAPYSAFMFKVNIAVKRVKGLCMLGMEILCLDLMWHQSLFLLQQKILNAVVRSRVRSHKRAQSSLFLTNINRQDCTEPWWRTGRPSAAGTQDAGSLRGPCWLG